MKEIGKVKEIVGDKVQISITSPASKCIRCGICKKKNGERVLTVKAEGMQVGDEVVVEIRERGLVILYMITFGIPILLFLVGVSVGYLLYKEVGGILMGGTGFILGLFSGRFFEKNSQLLRNLYMIKKVEK